MIGSMESFLNEFCVMDEGYESVGRFLTGREYHVVRTVGRRTFLKFIE